MLKTGTHAAAFRQNKADMTGRNLTVINLIEGVDVSGYVARRYIPNDFPPDFLNRLAACTEGHVQYLDLLMRLLEDRGDIIQKQEERGLVWTIKPGVDPADISIPEMRAVLDERIEAIEERLRNILTQASVESFADKNFTIQTIMCLNQLEAQSDKAFSDVEQLERAYQMVVSGGSQRRIGTVAFDLYRFAHDWIQEYIYDHRLADARKRNLHHRIGEFLEGLCSDGIKQISPQLALHFISAGEDEKALRYILMAAQQEFERSAWLGAEEWISRGEEILNREQEN